MAKVMQNASQSHFAAQQGRLTKVALLATHGSCGISN
jgi:hypothetical protein